MLGGEIHPKKTVQHSDILAWIKSCRKPFSTDQYAVLCYNVLGILNLQDTEKNYMFFFFLYSNKLCTMICMASMQGNVGRSVKSWDFHLKCSL